MVSTSLPDYDPKNFPTTEALLGFYDLATECAAENGESHRDNFRFICQTAEVLNQVKGLEQKKKKLIADIEEKRSQVVILKAVKEKRLFQG